MDLIEFEASLVYRVSCRTGKTVTQRKKKRCILSPERKPKKQTPNYQTRLLLPAKLCFIIRGQIKTIRSKDQKLKFISIPCR